MMERWKGARMAHKEKDRWDPTLTGEGIQSLLIFYALDCIA